MDAMDYVSQHSPLPTNDFQLHDFVDDANFDQFIDLIQGENEDRVFGFDCDLINGMVADYNQFGPTSDEIFGDFNGMCTNATAALPTTLHGGVKGGCEGNDIEGSSGATVTTTTAKKMKPDRSRTLVSERRRRGRMKEKLYALRSFVPNITKMDKASIIGDAILYLQDLQAKAKNLKADIADLESSLVEQERNQESIKNLKKFQTVNTNPPVSKKIMQMDVFQVDKRGFYVQLVCNKGEGVAVSLYRALESLTCFNVQSSSLATNCERFILTFTLNVKESEHDMNLANLKLWVTVALLNQGFEFLTSLNN